MHKTRLLRITTVPISLRILLKGQLEYMSEHGFEVLAVSASGPDVAALHVPHRVVPFTRAITPFRDLMALFALIRIIRQFRPEVVHTHTPKAGLLGMLAAWFCGIRVRIHTIGGVPWLEYHGFRRKLLRKMEELTIRCSTDILVNSYNLRGHLLREFPRMRRELLVLGAGSSNGIDLDHFRSTESLSHQAAQLRTALGIENSDIVFCFIGRLVLHKGVVELVEAFDRVRKQHPRVRLFLVGPWEQEREPLPAEVVARIHLGEGIAAPGRIDDVRPWLAASQVFVLPTWREGFPNVLLQAGCMGVPVIATDINGCNEIVASADHGTLIPPKQVDALVQAMLRAVEHPEYCQSQAVRLQEYIAAHFSQQRVWQDLLAFYHQKFR